MSFNQTQESSYFGPWSSKLKGIKTMLSVEISLKHYVGKDDQLDTRGYIQTSKYDCHTKYTNNEDEISVSLKRLNYHVIVA